MMVTSVRVRQTRGLLARGASSSTAASNTYTDTTTSNSSSSHHYHHSSKKKKKNNNNENDDTLFVYKQELLHGALSHVPTHGWTEAAIAHAAASLNKNNNSYYSLCGLISVGDLVAHAMNVWNDELRDELLVYDNKNKNQPDDNDTLERILYGIRYRLSRIPAKDHWPNAMAVGLLQQPLRTQQQVSDIVSLLLPPHSSSSSSLDRTIVTSIYVATELHWLSSTTTTTTTNSQDENEETWEFCRQRLLEWQRGMRSTTTSDDHHSSALWTATQVGSAVSSGLLSLWTTRTSPSTGTTTPTTTNNGTGAVDYSQPSHYKKK